MSALPVQKTKDTVTVLARPPEDFDKLRNAIVMMVDDEPVNIEVTQIYLEEAGYSRFVSTIDPTTAMALLASQRPDLLLLDLMMPEVSGFDILAQMRTTNMLKDVPTIVLTSSTDAQTKLKVLELGATDFLSKPVDPSELALRVRNTLAAKAYRELRRAQHRARLDERATQFPIDALASERDAVLALWRAVFG